MTQEMLIILKDFLVKNDLFDAFVSCSRPHWYSEYEQFANAITASVNFSKEHHKLSGNKHFKENGHLYMKVFML